MKSPISHLTFASCFNLVSSASTAPQENATEIALAGIIPEPVEPVAAGFNNQTILAQVQLAKYIRNAELAVFQYGIDNIPMFGLGGYPPSLIDQLHIWTAQAQYINDLLDQVLTHYNMSIVPPCEYTFAPDRLGTYINNTDIYLAILIEFFHVFIGQDLYFAGIANNGAIASSAGASAALEARRAAYVKTIAGVNPTPAPLDTIIPPAFAYWQLQYYIVPNSCPYPLDYGTFNALRGTGFTPPIKIKNLQVASAIPRGTTVSLEFNSTTAPKYAALLNQMNPVTYAPLMEVTEHTASFKVPDTVVGVVFLSLVSSKDTQDLVTVGKNTVAGPLDALIT